MRRRQTRYPTPTMQATNSGMALGSGMAITSTALRLAARNGSAPIDMCGICSDHVTSFIRCGQDTIMFSADLISFSGWCSPSEAANLVAKNPLVCERSLYEVTEQMPHHDARFLNELGDRRRSTQDDLR